MLKKVIFYINIYSLMVEYLFNGWIFKGWEGMGQLLSFFVVLSFLLVPTWNFRYWKFQVDFLYGKKSMISCLWIRKLEIFNQNRFGTK